MRPLFHTASEAYMLAPVMTDYSLYPRHSSLGGHYHAVYHIVLTLEGRGALVHDRGRSPMQPADILIINPGAKHVFETAGDVVRVFACNFYLITQSPETRTDARSLCGNTGWLEEHAEVRPLQELFSLASHGPHLLYDRSGPVWPRAVELASRLRDTVSDYLAVGTEEQRRDGYEAYIYQSSLFLLQLLALLMPERLVPASEARFRADPILRSIDRYLREHVDDKYHLDELARELGYAPAYLCAHFSRKTGTTIGAYHNRLRVLRACSELKSGNRSITQVGLGLGYSSPQHFSAAFRRVKNMSPREYRRQSEVY